MHPQSTPPRSRYPARVERRCIGCETIFSVPPSRIRYSAALWCSPECRYRTPGWQDTLKPGHRKQATCLNCGATFEAVASKVARYCSRRCLGVANGQRKHAERTRQLVTCTECGKSYETKRATVGRTRFCSRSCHGLWRANRWRVNRPTNIETLLRNGLTSAGIAFVPEYRVGRFRVDLAILDRHIAIEADGEYWHSTAKQRAADARKDAYLTANGWTVLRFGEQAIREDVTGCVQTIVTALA